MWLVKTKMGCRDLTIILFYICFHQCSSMTLIHVGVNEKRTRFWVSILLCRKTNIIVKRSSLRILWSMSIWRYRSVTWINIWQSIQCPVVGIWRIKNLIVNSCFHTLNKVCTASSSSIKCKTQFYETHTGTMHIFQRLHQPFWLLSPVYLLI